MNTETLKQQEFSGFKTIRELRTNNTMPKERGVYVVMRLNDDAPKFREEGTGGWFKGKDPNVSIAELQENWVDDAEIVYIGKAGGTGRSATLFSRFNQYLKFGKGQNIGHWGGRLIWQLADAEDLVVCWKPVTEVEPREYEKQMIADFKKIYGKRPFANLTD